MTLARAPRRDDGQAARWSAWCLVCVGVLAFACNHKPASIDVEVEASAPAVSSALAPADSAEADASVDDDDESQLDASAVDAMPDAYAKFASLPARTVLFGGPHKIASKAMQAWVHLYPDDETPFLGYIRAGAVIDRSAEPVAKTKRCPRGWYEVLPRGYLCNGRRATIDLDDPVVVASWKRPRRGEPLPYRYVRPSGDRTWLYFKLPSKKDQQRTEGTSWASHVGSHPSSRLANIEQLGDPEPIPVFLEGGKELPTPYGATRRLRYNVHEGRANPQGAFALLSVHDWEGRLFGLTTELDLIAIDRTDIVKPPPSHGGPVEDLPAGIVRSIGTPRYTVGEDGRPRKDGEWDRFAVVDLTGKTHDDLWEVRNGYWIAGGAIDRVDPRTSFPSFAEESRKWIDVSIKDQMLVAYIGKRAVYVARVSTGLGEMSDPNKTFATVRGAFTIKSKHVTATMTGSAQADYELADVPYVQYFHEGYALHGAFWHNNFGRVMSHGCVNLAPADAAWLFEFTDPVVPPEWHGANATADEPGTTVYVRY